MQLVGDNCGIRDMRCLGIWIGSLAPADWPSRRMGSAYGHPSPPTCRGPGKWQGCPVSLLRKARQHLHTASGYSARHGASLPGALAQRAAERGMTTLALTDRDTVADTVRFAHPAAAAGIRPGFGVDIGVAPLEPPTPRRARTRTPVRGGAHVAQAPLRIHAARAERGRVGEACRLVSVAHAQAGGLGAGRVRAGAARVRGRGPGGDARACLRAVRALSAGRPDLAEALLGPFWFRRALSTGLRPP